MNLRRLYRFARPYRPMRLTTGSLVFTPSTVMEVVADARPGEPGAQFPDGCVTVDVRDENGLEYEMRWHQLTELKYCVTDVEWLLFEDWVKT